MSFGTAFVPLRPESPFGTIPAPALGPDDSAAAPAVDGNGRHRGTRVDNQDSFPRLYGAPGTFRPPKAVEDTERPASTDDLPLEFDRSADESEFPTELVPRPYRHGARPFRPTSVEEDDGELRPSSVGLRGLAERFLSERGSRPIPEFRKPGERGVGSGPAGE